MTNKKYKFAKLYKTTGLFNYYDLKSTKGKIAYGAIYLFLIAFLMICLIPFLWVFLSSFKSVDEMYALKPTFFPKEFHFENLSIVLEKVNFVSYLLNTLCIILGFVAFDIIFNGIAGYVISKLKPFGTGLMEKLIFTSMLVPGISMVPLYMTFVDVPFLHFNLVGSYMPLWLMAASQPFNIMLFRNFFNGIPISYLEAARIDGASDIKIFAKIILPLSKPILMVVMVFGVTGCWGNFMWPYLLLGGTAREPISVMLYKLSSSSLLMQNEFLLLTMITMIPMIIVFALFSKQIMGGLNMSGLKG